MTQARCEGVWSRGRKCTPSGVREEVVSPSTNDHWHDQYRERVIPSALLHSHTDYQRPKSGQATMPSISRTCNPSMPVISTKPKTAQSARHTFARQRFPAGPPQRIPPVEADDVPSCAMSSSNRRCTPARRVGRLSSHTASAMCCARGRVPPGAIGLCVNVTPRCCCSGSWWSATRCAE